MPAVSPLGRTTANPNVPTLDTALLDLVKDGNSSAARAPEARSQAEVCFAEDGTCFADAAARPAVSAGPCATRPRMHVAAVRLLLVAAALLSRRSERTTAQRKAQLNAGRASPPTDAHGHHRPSAPRQPKLKARPCVPATLCSRRYLGGTERATCSRRSECGRVRVPKAPAEAPLYHSAW